MLEIDGYGHECFCGNVTGLEDINSTLAVHHCENAWLDS
jgi:hypothetical protein